MSRTLVARHVSNAWRESVQPFRAMLALRYVQVAFSSRNHARGRRCGEGLELLGPQVGSAQCRYIPPSAILGVFSSRQRILLALCFAVMRTVPGR